MENIVQDIERIIKERVMFVGEDGKNYSPMKLHPVCDDRKIEAIQLTSLAGLVQYAGSKVDTLEQFKVLCVVEGHTAVKLISKIQDATRARDHFVQVKLMEDGNRFNFGTFMEHEEFIIKLKSVFVSTSDRDNLIEYVSKLSINNSVEVQDDGISQSATVKKGMSGALRASQVAPVTVNLAPYRTFREVEQPVSSFLFRLRQGEGVPTCALFEADGGAWRLKAMQLIQEYLKAKLTGIEVIA